MVNLGDKNKVKIGYGSNVQDRAVIDCAFPSEEITSLPQDVDIGEYVTIGHGALIKSAVIGSEVIIGQGAIIDEGSVIENRVLVAAGSVVAAGTFIPSGQLWAGSPAKYVRDLTEEDIASIKQVCFAHAL